MRVKIILGSLMGVVAINANAQIYVKGSVGTSSNRIGSFEFINPSGTPDAATPLSGSKIIMNGVKDSSTSSNSGLGIGYQFVKTPYRLELRLESRAEAEALGFGSFGGNLFAQQLKYRSDSMMAYAFHDIALNSQHELFLGLGLGTSRNKVRGLQGANRGSSNFFPEKTRQETAWGLAFGYAYAINSNLKIDAELGYTNLGRVDTGVTDASMAPVIALNQNVGEQLTGKWTTTELKLGMRFSFQ